MIKILLLIAAFIAAAQVFDPWTADRAAFVVLLVWAMVSMWRSGKRTPQ